MIIFCLFAILGVIIILGFGIDSIIGSSRPSMRQISIANIQLKKAKLPESFYQKVLEEYRQAATETNYFICGNSPTFDEAWNSNFKIGFEQYFPLRGLIEHNACTFLANYKEGACNFVSIASSRYNELFAFREEEYEWRPRVYSKTWGYIARIHFLEWAAKNITT